MSFDVSAGRFEGKFEGKIVKNAFVFSLTDVHLQKIFYDFLQFRIFCNCFYCVRGRRNVGKCDVCSRFFCWRFRYCLKNRPRISPNQEWHSAPAYLWTDLICEAPVLNLYYLVEEYGGKAKINENFGEILLAIANNPFGAYIFICRFIWECFLISWRLSRERLLKII